MSDLDIYAQRRHTLSWFFDVAEKHLASQPAARSVMLGCAQYWSDEAEDAVQEETWCSEHVVPLGTVGTLPSPQIHLEWRANTDAVFAFSAICNEEGWTPNTGTVDPELKNIYHYVNSPVLLVQRSGALLHATWLGRPLRAWLDFPGAFRERDYRSGSEPVEAIEDPPMPALVGREPELYDQVLADPYDCGPRDVLRDLWSERGDPRGEFCAVTSDPRLHARAAELVAAHGRSWIGDLQPVIPFAGALFGYGPFVKKAIVYAPDQAAFDRVANAPAWGAIEAITFAPGSVRRVVPAMRNVRAIGPLDWNAAAPLREGSWLVEELDLELVMQPELLSTFSLPLRTLRLRAPTKLDRDWLARLSLLGDAIWRRSLERLEIWLPCSRWATGMSEQTIAEIQRVFAIACAQLPKTCTLAIGILDGDQRTGWMFAGEGDTRRLELVHPDVRFDLGTELAAATGLPLEPRILDDDWLALGLGVPSIRSLPVRDQSQV